MGQIEGLTNNILHNMNRFEAALVDKRLMFDDVYPELSDLVWDAIDDKNVRMLVRLNNEIADIADEELTRTLDYDIIKTSPEDGAIQ